MSQGDATHIMNKIAAELSPKADTFPELKGDFVGLRKYWVGNYRIIYSIMGNNVLVVRIRHRKDVYRK